MDDEGQTLTLDQFREVGPLISASGANQPLQLSLINASFLANFCRDFQGIGIVQRLIGEIYKNISTPLFKSLDMTSWYRDFSEFIGNYDKKAKKFPTKGPILAADGGMCDLSSIGAWIDRTTCKNGKDANSFLIQFQNPVAMDGVITRFDDAQWSKLFYGVPNGVQAGATDRSTSVVFRNPDTTGDWQWYNDILAQVANPSASNPTTDLIQEEATTTQVEYQKYSQKTVGETKINLYMFPNDLTVSADPVDSSDLTVGLLLRCYLISFENLPMLNKKANDAERSTNLVALGLIYNYQGGTFGTLAAPGGAFETQFNDQMMRFLRVLKQPEVSKLVKGELKRLKQNSAH